jgi:hypothetical protein
MEPIKQPNEQHEHINDRSPIFESEDKAVRKRTRLLDHNRSFRRILMLCAWLIALNTLMIVGELFQQVYIFAKPKEFSDIIIYLVLWMTIVTSIINIKFASVSLLSGKF